MNARRLLKSSLGGISGLQAVLMAAAVLAGFGLQEIRQDDITVVVDAEVEGGSTIELFHNQLWTESQRIALRPGRHLYRFERLPRRLWALRLDPTDGDRARIRLFRMFVEKRGHQMQEFGPAEIRRWTATNAEPVGTSDDVAEFVPLNNDPNLIAPGVYDFSDSSDGLFGLVQAKLGETQRFLVVFLLVFLLAGAIPWTGWRQAAWSVLVPVAACLAVLAQRALSLTLDGRLGGIVSAAEAIGNANYHGYPKTSDFNLYFLSVAIGVGLGVVAGAVLSHFVRPLGGESRPSGATRSTWVTVGLAAALLVLYALSSFPLLGAQLYKLEHQVHHLSYDSGNFFTWEYLVHRGWKPFVDFWYPYGSFSRFNAGGVFPWGYVVGWLNETALLAIAAWSLLRITWPACWVGLAIIAVLVGGLDLGVLAGANRYFLALDLGLLTLAARAGAYQSRYLSALALFGAYSFALEPNQVFYATFPVAILAALDMWRADVPKRIVLARRFAFAIGTFSGGVALVLLVLRSHGQLQGFMDFLAQMSAMTTYASLPASFDEWSRPSGTQTNLVLWAPVALSALAVTVLSWRREVSKLVAEPLVLGLLGTAVFLKFVVRPHIASQIAAFSVVGVALTLWRIAPHLRFAQRLALLGLVGGLLANHVDAGVSAVRSRFQQLKRLPESLRVLNRDSYAGTEMSFYEDAERYPDYLPVLTRLKELIHGDRPGSPEATIFDLGDDSALYVALRQKPPYYITLYNGAPLEAQQATEQWLAHERPQWLVWRPSFQSFDDVPNTVRVPLLFAAAVADYQPFERIGDYEILKRRDRVVPVDVAFWAQRLGATLDLGALPSVSGLQGARVCRVEPCAETLRVTIASPVAGRRRTVRVNVGAREFKMTFSEEMGQHEYYVYLDRLWFYGPLARTGLRPEVVQDAGPGAKVCLQRVFPDRPVLW
jgi:hypothetical protein